jgi:hypothetical protein
MRLEYIVSIFLMFDFSTFNFISTKNYTPQYFFIKKYKAALFAAKLRK